MKLHYQLTILGCALLLAACGSGGSGGGTSSPTGASTGASIIGTVPGTTIEALGDNGSYYAVESNNNGTAQHPFQLDVPSNLGFHLVMITGKGTAEAVVIPIGFRDSANNVKTRFMLGKGDVVDLGYIPLPMSRIAAAAQDLDNDGVLDIPLVLDDVTGRNPLPQTHVNQLGVTDWSAPNNGGYHYDNNTIDPQDVDRNGIPNLYDRRYTRAANDSDGDGLPDNVDANPYNQRHQNAFLPDDLDKDGYSDEDRNHDGFYDDDKDRDGRHDDPTPTPTPPPPLSTAGEGLYYSNCAGCHDGEAIAGGGRQVLGARECSIQGAINGTSVFRDGVPTMQFLQGLLSDAQIRQIADYLNAGTVTGYQRYMAACAGCHGNDARGGRSGEDVRGDDGGKIREYIYEKSEMRFLSCLPRLDTDSIGYALTGKEPFAPPPTPTPPSPPPPPPTTQCSDGVDNDGDGLIDLADPGCTDANDNDETGGPPPPTTQCSDGVDNDGDGLIDLADPGCASSSDNDESNAPPPPPPPPTSCTLPIAIPTCSSCHGGTNVYPASHVTDNRAKTCASCHGPVNDGSGTPSIGMSAVAGTGGTCDLNYPFGGGSTHSNLTVNRGAAQ